jgi:hypothetical protein
VLHTMSLESSPTAAQMGHGTIAAVAAKAGANNEPAHVTLPLTQSQLETDLSMTTAHRVIGSESSAEVSRDISLDHLLNEKQYGRFASMGFSCTTDWESWDKFVKGYTTISTCYTHINRIHRYFLTETSTAIASKPRIQSTSPVMSKTSASAEQVTVVRRSGGQEGLS